MKKTLAMLLGVFLLIACKSHQVNDESANDGIMTAVNQVLEEIKGRGMQMLSVVSGATMIQDLRPSSLACNTIRRWLSRNMLAAPPTPRASWPMTRRFATSVRWCGHRPIRWTLDRILADFCGYRPIRWTLDRTRAVANSQN